MTNGLFFRALVQWLPALKFRCLSLPALEAWTLLSTIAFSSNRNNHFVLVEVRWTCPRDHVWEKFLRKVKKTINIRSNHVFNQSSCFCDHFRHKNAYDVKCEATVRREKNTILFTKHHTSFFFVREKIVRKKGLDNSVSSRARDPEIHWFYCNWESAWDRRAERGPNLWPRPKF